MFKRSLLVLIVGLSALLTGCASSVMQKVDKEEPIPNGKASITFFRSSYMGGAILAPVVREDSQHTLTFVGESTAGDRFRDIVDPGEYNYIVSSESANLLKAKVEANKRYYVRIEPGIGWVVYRFFFHAIKPEELATEKIQKEILSTNLTTQNAKASNWIDTHKKDSEQNLELAKKKFEDMKDTSNNVLNPEDGIDQLY